MSLLVAKKPKRTTSNPLKYDPSGTGQIRRQFMRQIEAKFKELNRRVYQRLVNEHQYGLTQNYDPAQPRVPAGSPEGGVVWSVVINNVKSEFYGWNYEIVANSPYDFPQSENYLSQFKQWLLKQMSELFYNEDENSWWREYIAKGWQLGAAKVYNAWKSPSEFLKSSFNVPVSVNKVKLLAARVFTELENVTQDMATKMSRELVDGLIQGMSPREVARNMSKSIEGISKARALAIARTEVVRSHANGQLDTLEQLGMQHVGVAVEWSTSGLGMTRKKNPSPCPICAPMQGVVFTLEEARGMIPRHPNCLCSLIPANVGEDGKGQIRSFKGVSAALGKSVRAEIPKRSKRTVATQAKLSRWAGATAKVSKSRPESILNMELIDNLNPYHDAQGRFCSKENAVNWHEIKYQRTEPIYTRPQSKHVDEVTHKALIDAELAQQGGGIADKANMFRSEMSKHNKELEVIRQKLVKDVARHEREIAKHGAEFKRILDEHSKASNVDEKKANKLNRQGIASHNRLSKAREKLEYAKVEARNALLDHIGTKDPAPVKLWGLAAMPESSAKRALEAAEWYGQILSKKVVSRPDKGYHSIDAYPIEDGRSFAQNKSQSKVDFGVDHEIHMAHHAAVDIHIHEIGHTIEFANPKINDMTLGFIHHRVQGELPQPYPYGDKDEVGFKDEFGKSFSGHANAIYVGKHYASGATEILAMGFQKLYNNPGEFAHKDPEYFKFLIGVLRGDFSERK
jgi:hypothetical protein